MDEAASVGGNNNWIPLVRMDGPEDEIIPLFERDVAELDTGVDLPDETLLTDHISSGDKDVSFGRMKPLRFSVGRKLRNKVDNSSRAATPDSFVISNHSADLSCQQRISCDLNCKIFSHTLKVYN